MTPLKALLVEDEDIVSMLIETMLNELGYAVIASAANLKDGLKASAIASFDVAILDINLRGVMSYPIAEVLIEREIPFVFTSGYSVREIEPRYAKRLAIQKPFTIASLGEVLSRALAEDGNGPF